MYKHALSLRRFANLEDVQVGCEGGLHEAGCLVHAPAARHSQHAALIHYDLLGNRYMLKVSLQVTVLLLDRPTECAPMLQA